MTTNVKDNRVHWIDIYKGLAISLVVLQHCLGGGELSKYILSFHMALFFFMSGYLYKEKDCKEVLRKTGVNFLKVQILIGLLNCLKYYLFMVLLFKQSYQQRWLDYFTTWFLPTLFYITLVACILHKICGYDLIKQVVAISLTVFLAYMVKAFLPYEKDQLHVLTAPLAFGFFYLGVIFKQRNIVNLVIERYKYILLVVNVFILILSVQNNTVVYWYNYEIGNILWAICSSLSGICIMLILSKSINSNKLIEFYGKNSMIIYSTQFLIYWLCQTLIHKMCQGYINSNLIQGFMAFCCTMLISIPVIFSLRKSWIFN